MTALFAKDHGYQLVELDEDHLKAHAFNMLFVVWRKLTLDAAYRRGLALVHDLAARFPEGVGVCQVVETDAVPPDGNARAAFVDFLKITSIRHCSVTHDGVGFKAAAVRAIIIGANAAARPKALHTVLSNVGDAGRWHASAQRALGRNEPAGLIEGIVTRLRAHHREQYP